MNCPTNTSTLVNKPLSPKKNGQIKEKEVNKKKKKKKKKRTLSAPYVLVFTFHLSTFPTPSCLFIEIYIIGALSLPFLVILAFPFTSS